MKVVISSEYFEVENIYENGMWNIQILGSVLLTFDTHLQYIQTIYKGPLDSISFIGGILNILLYGTYFSKTASKKIIQKLARVAHSNFEDNRKSESDPSNPLFPICEEIFFWWCQGKNKAFLLIMLFNSIFVSEVAKRVLLFFQPLFFFTHISHWNSIIWYFLGNLNYPAN